MRKYVRERIGPVTSIVLISGLIAACSPVSPTPTLQPTISPVTESPKETTMPKELDLREANIVAVTLEQVKDNEFLFNVTLQHDDEGEAPNFADWWQVEDLKGNVLGRRVLLHAHSNQPFTRSTKVIIPTDIDTVIIRGHDMLHDFGGQAMRMELATGETSAFDEDLDVSE
jgi:hypothetical protein